ncbi:Protein of unknown function DUF4487, partial [Trinorchestia longiramus]
GWCCRDVLSEEVRDACCALDCVSSSTPGDRWWSCLLAADLIVFVARVGSGELCNALYSSLCRASVSVQHSPHLVLLLLRLQRCLPEHVAQHEVSHWENLPLLLRCHFSSALVFDVAKTSTTTVSERYLSCLSDVCEAAEVTISALLSSSSAAQCERLLLQLGERLQRLHAAVGSRSPDAGGGPACVTAVATALGRLWQRLPRKCVESKGGAWLVGHLATITAHLTDLFSDDQLLTMLQVCRSCVEWEAASAGSGRRGLGEAVTRLWRSLTQRNFAASYLRPITDTLAGLCCVLLSERQDPWLYQQALSSFMLYAQRTPHKQIVAAILQRCSADVKTRLQQYVLGKPHPAPLRGPSHEGQDSDSHEATTPPLFFFHQQCIINSKISAARNRSCSLFHPCESSDGQDLCDDGRGDIIERVPLNAHYLQDNSHEICNQEQSATAPSKRPLLEQDSAMEDISRNLSSCQELIAANKIKGCVAGDHMQEPLDCSERLLQLLEAAFAGPTKKIKADTCHS